MQQYFDKTTVGDNQTKRQNMVSHRALHAERLKHKKTQAKSLKLRKQLDEMQLAYFNLLMSQKKKSSNDVARTAPDPRQDIVTYIRWLAMNC